MIDFYSDLIGFYLALAVFVTIPFVIWYFSLRFLGSLLPRLPRR